MSAEFDHIAASNAENDEWSRGLRDLSRRVRASIRCDASTHARLVKLLERERAVEQRLRQRIGVTADREFDHCSPATRMLRAHIDARIVARCDVSAALRWESLGGPNPRLHAVREQIVADTERAPRPTRTEAPLSGTRRLDLPESVVASSRRSEALGETERPPSKQERADLERLG